MGMLRVGTGIGHVMNRRAADQKCMRQSNMVKIM